MTTDSQTLSDLSVNVEGELLRNLIRICQTNPWIKIGSCEFEPEGFCVESDYPYGLRRYFSREHLREFFEHGNWGIRSAVVFDSLIFVQQVNGGDEWWTLKIDGDQLVPFESMSMARIIENGHYDNIMDRLLQATAEQCRKLEY